MTFQKTIPKRIDVNNTSKPNTPSLEIPNPLRSDIFVNGIELLLDPLFSKKGELIIQIDNNTVFSTKSQSLKNYSLYPISLSNEILKDQKKIKVFAWNGTDSNTIGLNLNVTFSEENNPISTTAQPLGIDVLNRASSDKVTLFPNEPRTSGFDDSALIDLKGHEIMMVLMSAINNIPPTVILGSSAIVDEDLNTKMLSASFTDTDPEKDIAIIDFGSIDTRIPTAKIGMSVAGSTWTFRLYVSNDGVSWGSAVASTTIGQTTATIQGASQSFRYMKVTVDFDSGSGLANADVYELYDANTFGGTASLSFQVKNDSSGNWVTAITSVQIGTITQGEEVVKIIGNVINDVANDKFNFSLPQTQTDFRARLQISGGGLNIGVTVFLI